MWVTQEDLWHEVKVKNELSIKETTIVSKIGTSKKGTGKQRWNDCTSKVKIKTRQS